MIFTPKEPRVALDLGGDPAAEPLPALPLHRRFLPGVFRTLRALLLEMLGVDMGSSGALLICPLLNFSSFTRGRVS